MKRRKSLFVLLLVILPAAWVGSRVDPGQAHNCSYIVITLQGTTSTMGDPNCLPTNQEPTHTCTSLDHGVVAESVCVHD